jgi:hypothetical protein
MSITLYIKAAPGMKFMVEGKPKTRISEKTPLAVKASHYYRKAIKDKDLIELSKQEWDAYQATRSEPQPAAAPANSTSTSEKTAATNVPAATSAASPGAVAATASAAT